jgi:hypothetical protein
VDACEWLSVWVHGESGGRECATTRSGSSGRVGGLCREWLVVRTGSGGGGMIMMPVDVGGNNLDRCSVRAMAGTANGGECMVESACGGEWAERKME